MPDDAAAPGDPKWSDESLLETAGSFAGVGSDAALPEPDRFRAGVSRLIGKYRRLQEGQGEEAARRHEGLAVFLLDPTPPKHRTKESNRVPMFDQGREPVEGRVWFVSQVVTVGTWLSAEFETDDELIRFITEDLGRGATPAIIYDSRGSAELRFYSNGLSDLETYDSLRVAYSEISIVEIFDRIDVIHRNHLVTPGAQHRGTRVWESASEGRPMSNAEDILGGLLTVGLQGAFPMCIVRVEQPQPSGRLDIEIEERVLNEPGTIQRHAILELKVLRSVGRTGRSVSPRTIRRWVKDGVGQAAAYRQEKAALAAGLCCFDMRSTFSGTQCFAHVLTLAAELDVQLRVWHLFSSAGTYRAHQIATKSLV